jgi:hypothetical protein
VAYLPHARKVESQNQPFLSNTRTNNGTAGLRNPFLGYGSVNTLSYTPYIQEDSNLTLNIAHINKGSLEFIKLRIKFHVSGFP